MSYKQNLFKILAEADISKSAPVLLDDISKLQEEMFGSTTGYKAIKSFYNQYVLSKMTDIEKKIAQAEDPLLCAMQYAMTGNYIDFGAMDAVDKEQFEQLLRNVGNIKLSNYEYKMFCNELITAKKLVYLTDNCGEIVFDKAFIDCIRKKYPLLQITAIVRGKEILNDATMEDAEQIGLTKNVSVIGNGNGIAGTCLDMLDKQARIAIEEADLIIAKGQGNFETLYECGLNIYYMFLCKCKMFSERFGVEQYTGLLLNDRRL